MSMSSLASARGYQQPYPTPPAPPRPGVDPGLPAVHIEPPMVYVEPTFEYKQVSREMGDGAPISDDELDELGRAGWELVSVINDGRAAHFYFKRTSR
jgi:hypothetical protein